MLIVSYHINSLLSQTKGNSTYNIANKIKTNMQQNKKKDIELRIKQDGCMGIWGWKKCLTQQCHDCLPSSSQGSRTSQTIATANSPRTTPKYSDNK